MKKIIQLMLLLCFVAQMAMAQGLGEWFNQKKTQKKYLAEQIAALKVYTGYLQKGYEIAKDGLQTISDFKKGEFELHDAFFDSLKHVSAKVKAHARASEVVKLQDQIISVRQQAMGSIGKLGTLQPDELSYLDRVFERLLKSCEKTLEELIAVTSNNRLQMSDDERIKRIDQLSAQMKDNYLFCKSFASDSFLLAKGRENLKHEVNTSRLINGLKN